MTHEQAWERLSDYLDGELPVRERAGLESHLTGCPDCAATLDDYRTIGRLAREYTPPPAPTDPWAGIAMALGATRRRWIPGTRALAAASVVIVAAATLLWLRPGTSGHTGTGEPGGGSAAVQTSTGAGDPLGGSGFARDVAALQEVFVRGRDRMDPRTVEVVEESLRAIDEALDRAGAALAEDPANPLLRDLVERGREQKLDLLRDVTRSM